MLSDRNHQPTHHIVNLNMRSFLSIDKTFPSFRIINLRENSQLRSTVHRGFIFQVIGLVFGKFNFEKLPYDKNYLLAFDVEDNTPLSGIKSFVVLNNKGETILKSEKGDKGKFSFEVLKNDQMTLSLMSVEDAAIEVDAGREIAFSKS